MFVYTIGNIFDVIMLIIIIIVGIWIVMKKGKK